MPGTEGEPGFHVLERAVVFAEELEDVLGGHAPTVQEVFRSGNGAGCSAAARSPHPAGSGKIFEPHDACAGCFSRPRGNPAGDHVVLSSSLHHEMAPLLLKRRFLEPIGDPQRSPKPHGSSICPPWSSRSGRSVTAGFHRAEAPATSDRGDRSAPLQPADREGLPRMGSSLLAVSRSLSWTRRSPSLRRGTSVPPLRACSLRAGTAKGSSSWRARVSTHRAMSLQPSSES